MAIRYGYFDSEIVGVDEEGMPIFDRAETSELFALFFSKLVTNGVLAKPANCFQVTAGDTGLSVKVAPGFGMVNGHFAYDNAEEVLQLEPAPTSYSRIDRVVLRCNYLERLCEIIVKTGTPASTPAPPELLQPASGDYYELGLALIIISANQSVLTQSQITDTRANSAICGYITQLIDSIDTSVFFAQFEQFYKEFVEKSNASYDEFQEMASTAYSGYTQAIDDYIGALEAKGDSDLADITASFKEFQRVQQNAFNEWFADIKGQLDTDIAGHLQNEITEHEDRLTQLERMLIQNEITAPIRADDDSATTLLADDDGNVLIADWKYKYA